MQARPQLLVTWGLWGLAMLVTLAFIPVGYRVTHQVLHLSGGLGSSLGVWTRLALEVGAHLELVAALWRRCLLASCSEGRSWGRLPCLVSCSVFLGSVRWSLKGF